jgi:hypothetical protein
MFWLQTSEACLRPNNDCGSQKHAFWAQKGPFLEFYNPLETINEFPCPQMAIYSKIYFLGQENCSERLVLVKIGPF